MKRTVSSDKPFGALSDSMSVTNPYLYWSTSMRRTRSIVSCTAGIHSPPLRLQGPWVGFRSVWSVRFPVGAPLQAAISCCFPDLYRLSASLAQAFRNASISASVEEYPKLRRMAPRARPVGTPMAASTWDGVTLPDEQAAPDDTATPSRSSAITAVSAFTPGTANSVVLGSRVAASPKMTACGSIALSPASSRSRSDAIAAASSRQLRLTEAAAAP